jgi:leader peptidase (prepilin peptidase)/N-methyltransferase
MRELKVIYNRCVLWCLAVISAAAMLLMLLLVKKVDFISAIKLLSLYCILIPIAIIDYKHHIIPNCLTLICTAIALLSGVIEVAAKMSVLSEKALDMAAGLLFGGGVFGLAALLSKGGVGMGDVKLFAALGLALGLRLIFSLVLYTLISAAIISTVLIITKRAAAGTRLALGPYILSGMVFAIILG